MKRKSKRTSHNKEVILNLSLMYNFSEYSIKIINTASFPIILSILYSVLTFVQIAFFITILYIHFTKTNKKKDMSYYFSTILTKKNFDEAIAHVTLALKQKGFGVLTEIDIKETLKKKIDVDFKKYKILGACNPHFAYKALSLEDKIGLMLPCNIIVEEHKNGDIEVSAVDPIASMGAVKNDALGNIASEVQEELKSIIENL